MVLPSFQDIHVHPVYAGIEAVDFVDLNAARTQDEYLAAIAEYARTHPDEPWIRGVGWSMDAFEADLPHARAIDEVVSDRPVYRSSADGHSAWVNSKALEMAGIDRNTPDPEDG